MFQRTGLASLGPPLNTALGLHEMIRTVAYWLVFGTLFLVGATQFVATFEAEHPLPISNAILPALALSILVALSIKGQWARYYCIVACLALVALAVIAGTVYATPGSAYVLVPVFIVLAALAVDMILSNGAKAFFERSRATHV